MKFERGGKLLLKLEGKIFDERKNLAGNFAGKILIEKIANLPRKIQTRKPLKNSKNSYSNIDSTRNIRKQTISVFLNEKSKETVKFKKAKL